MTSITQTQQAARLEQTFYSQVFSPRTWNFYGGALGGRLKGRGAYCRSSQSVKLSFVRLSFVRPIAGLPCWRGFGPMFAANGLYYQESGSSEREILSLSEEYSQPHRRLYFRTAETGSQRVTDNSDSRPKQKHPARAERFNT